MPSKPPTKAKILAELAEKSGLDKKQVIAVFDALEVMIAANLKKHGKFKMLGLMNIKLRDKKAVKAHKGINPFTKEPMMFKAKPARNVVKVTALKGLKSMV